MSGSDDRRDRMRDGGVGRPRDGGVDRPAGGEADARFVAFLREAAADYNRPPETPREALWALIEDGWRGRSAGADDLALEEPLAGAAGTYNVPPEPPREEMWARVEGAWRLRASARESSGGAGVVPIGARAGTPGPGGGAGPGRAGGAGAAGDGRAPLLRRVPWAWAVGMAAVLLVGIAIGRLSVEEMGRRPGSAVVAGAADAGPDGAERTSPPSGVEAPAAGAEADPAAGDAPPVPEEPLPDPIRDAPPAEGLADAGTVEPGPADAGAPPRRGGSADGAGSLAMRAATLEHLGRTEAFLTSFRTDAGSGDPEARRVARWAGELLSDTRLLLDWPAGRDPRMTALLQELELVLAQIARLDDGRAEGERALIVEGLERTDVLPRLRATIPAGTAIPTRGV